MTASTGAPSSGWNASSLRSAWTATSREYPDAGHAWNRPIGAGAARAGTRPGVLTSGMAVEGEYEPSTQGWVREQVELYESSGGTEGTTLRDTGLPVVIITNRGARSGKVRKTPLMRVEHDGRNAAVASQGGARPIRAGITTSGRIRSSNSRTARASGRWSPARSLVPSVLSGGSGRWPRFRRTPGTSGRPPARFRYSSWSVPGKSEPGRPRPARARAVRRRTA